MRVAITGATGYIGGELLRGVLGCGWEPIALSRRPLGDSALSWVPYDLAMSVSEISFGRATVVVHLAANTSVDPALGEAQELAGGARLLKAASDRGARVLFVSSQAAVPGAPTAYGRIKHQLAKLVTEHGGTVVRPGLVYGGPPKGLFGTMCRIISRSIVLPDIRPAPSVQPIHVDELVRAMVTLVGGEQFRGGSFNIGAPRPVGFTGFLKALARHYVKRPRVFAPVPASVTLATARFIDWFAATHHHDRLHSLFSVPLMDTQEDIDQLGIRVSQMASPGRVA